jgi:beta-lactamase superfamily II metal-dependent hydrolase
MPKSLLTIAALSLFWACSPASSQQPGQVEIVFLDVGQGDAVLIRSPEGKTALVDAGPGSVAHVLARRYGVDSVDLAVATHPHADHIGGMVAILLSFPVRYYMDNGAPHTTSTYSHLMATLQRSDVTYLQATQRSVELGSVTIRVLPPPEDGTGLNNRSIGLLLEYGEFRALLTGDSEAEELNHFLSLGVPQATLLKAAHHGSRDAVTPAWLAATKPRVVVISSGRGNSYGHPHEWALRYYDTAAEAVYRTDVHGDITIRGGHDGGYEVETRFVPSDGAAILAPGPSAVDPIEVRVYPAGPEEHAVVGNNTARAVAIGGWGLCNAASFCYIFPDDASIAAGDSLIVYTGAGPSGGRSLYMDGQIPSWDDDGDAAVLRDLTWDVVATYGY